MEWEILMATYRLKFFKNLVSSDGHPFKVLQRLVSVEESNSIEDAIRVGKRRFERLEAIPDWKLHADVVEPTVDAEPTAQARPKLRGQADA